MQRRLSPLDPRPIAVLAGIWAALAIPRLGGPGRVPEPSWIAGPERAAPCARELRRWPGIGPRRAQAIVEHRWTHGPDHELEDVPGIGPLTARAVREAQNRDP